MILAYKKRYHTCLQMLEELRAERPELAGEKLSYNGILDPMAEGVVPVLVGEEENKNRDRFTGSVKEYEVGVLVGVSTDSGDLLGIVKSTETLRLSSVLTTKGEEIARAFLEYPSEFEQIVPMHSNRKVRGKRLWWWILNGVEIPEEERPKNTVKILEREFLGEDCLSLDDLKKEIGLMKKNIGERFRLGAVVDSWNNYFTSENVMGGYMVLKFRVKVSSGFYVRTWVGDNSRVVGIPMTVLSLTRTKVILNIS